MTNLTNLTIRDANKLLTSKQVKAAELTKAYLQRAQKFNKKLNVLESPRNLKYPQTTKKFKYRGRDSVA